MAMRGIRGAITVDEDSKEKIWQAAQHLVTKILSINKFHAEDIGAIIFSTTEDLTSAFPTSSIRQLQPFKMIPLFDTREPAVENSLPLCIRVLILINTDKKQSEIQPVYLGGAAVLRPDLKNNS